MDIFLVRHAQSQSNVDPNILKIQTNMAINLSPIGIEQATETGFFLADYIINSNNNPIKPITVKVWNSPYNRTRQTAQLIKEQLSQKNHNILSQESIYISERQFGLVDDVEDYHQKFKHEDKHYQLHKESNHDFFARPPLGESPFDMCLRLDFFLKKFIANDKTAEQHIVVSHGAAIRGLIMMHQNQTYEEYTAPNPPNASVRLLNDSFYIGEIFKPKQSTF
jgi:broad specificity phosphatase PhoE